MGELIEALVRHAPALAPDLQFHLLKSVQAPAQLSEAPNVVEHCVAPGTNSPISMWFLPEIAPVAGCDIFHATANILPARLTPKTLVTVHDIMWLDTPELCDASWHQPIRQAFFAHGIKRALDKADKVAVISEATRAAVLLHNRAIASRVSVTLPGVDERFAPVARDETTLNRLGLGPASPYILVVGQYAPYKNQEGALHAFAEAFEGADNVKLVMVQRRGPEPRRLEKLARSLGVEDRIVFSGPIEEADLIQLYSSAAALLHPSLCEGFGNPIIEAMACGCPVITSGLSAMPEVAGGAALLVSPNDIASVADALQRLWHDEVLREDLRAAGLKRARSMKWSDFAKANVEIYRSLLSD